MAWVWTNSTLAWSIRPSSLFEIIDTTLKAEVTPALNSGSYSLPMLHPAPPGIQQVTPNDEVPSQTPISNLSLVLMLYNGRTITVHFLEGSNARVSNVQIISPTKNDANLERGDSGRSALDIPKAYDATTF